MIVAGTGHRPNKLGGYSPQAYGRVLLVAGAALEHLQPTRVISGVALGWDTALALAAILRGVPLVAAVPFAGQEQLWPLESQRTYHWILERAAAVEVLSSAGYSRHKMQVRNMAMVDDCDCLAACWDGSAGGTLNCLEYAAAVGRPAWNYYPLLTP